MQLYKEKNNTTLQIKQALEVDDEIDCKKTLIDILASEKQGVEFICRAKVQPRNLNLSSFAQS